MTGNGDFDGISNWGQSIVRLNGSMGIAVTDWFTPNNWLNQSYADNDLGSTGPMLLPGTDFLIGGGKEGMVYLMNRSRLGRLQTGNSQIMQSFQAVTYGLFNRACWARSRGPLLYLWGWSDALKCYRMVGAEFETEPYSVNPSLSGTPYIGMAISADGDTGQSGILWVTTADRIDQPEPGTLHAYDASDLPRELWNSDQNPTRDTLGNFAKFATPTVANGRVYVPTFSKQVAVYGLIGPSDPAAQRGGSCRGRGRLPCM